MILSMISFTENGERLSEHIVKLLEKEMEVRLYTKCRACGNDHGLQALYVKTSVRDWAKGQMQERNALLFIGACGIAVRAAAPFLTDKLQDAPVLVMDETGRYIIPILSGHMGGANSLAHDIARLTGAEAVITTATDIRGKFAVDLFAKRNGLIIVNKDGIQKVSSKILAGKEITMSVEPMQGNVRTGLCGLAGTDGRIKTNCPPEGVRLVPYPPGDGSVDVVITSKACVPDAALVLKPKEYIIGIGCKKGKAAKEIDHFITKRLNELGISAAQVFALSSIAQKRREPGLVQWCQKEGVLFLTYTAEELQEIEGDFTESSFVKEQMGVGNVCERAAVKACGTGGKLTAQKYAECGMTIAAAKRIWTVTF